MPILALDTSTEYCSVAVEAGGEWFELTQHAVRSHSALVLASVANVLEQAGVAMGDLRVIAFGAGPGSFTGLRITCAVAQGLGFGLGIPLVAVPTLEAMAEASKGDRVVAALDARMKEAYLAAFMLNGQRWRCVIEPMLVDPQCPPELPGDNWVAAGGGFAAYPSLVEHYRSQLTHVDSSIVPRARAIGVLGMARFRAGEAVAADEAHPIYIRDKVALTSVEQGAVARG